MTARVETYVGAGGKTTTIFFRALKARQLGKKVAVVTTTHMMRPRQGFVPGDLPAGWKEQWQMDGIIVVGTSLDNGPFTVWPDSRHWDRLSVRPVFAMNY